jgi:hypothetical protein
VTRCAYRQQASSTDCGAARAGVGLRTKPAIARVAYLSFMGHLIRVWGRSPGGDGGTPMKRGASSGSIGGPRWERDFPSTTTLALWCDALASRGCALMSRLLCFGQWTCCMCSRCHVTQEPCLLEPRNRASRPSPLPAIFAPRNQEAARNQKRTAKLWRANLS